MGLKEIYEWDKSVFIRFKNFQLTNRYKRIGIFLFILFLAGMIGLKFIEGEPSWIKMMFRNGMIVSLLMASLSKEKIEDELVVTVRSQSYRIAFLIGVIYAVIQPYVYYIVEFILDTGKGEFSMGYFQVLFFMLLIQLALFHMMLKKCA